MRKTLAENEKNQVERKGKRGLGSCNREDLASGTGWGDYVMGGIFPLMLPYVSGRSGNPETAFEKIRR